MPDSPPRRREELPPAEFWDGSVDGGGSETKKTLTAVSDERQENLGRLLGALRLLYKSWAGVLRKDELDRRAWSWYVSVRPDVEAGPSGWGAKGHLNLGKILDLRRAEGSAGAKKLAES